MHTMLYSLFNDKTERFKNGQKIMKVKMYNKNLAIDSWCDKNLTANLGSDTEIFNQ